MSGLIWIVIVGAMCAAGGCGALLVRRRMYTAYPLLTIFLLFAFARTAVLLYAIIDNGASQYVLYWLSTVSVVVLLHLIVTGEAFIKLARRHAMGSFAFLIGGFFAVISAVVAIKTAGIRNPGWVNTVSASTRLLRYEAFACLTFIVIVVFFFSQFARVVKIPANVQAHLLILATYFACIFFGNIILEMDTETRPYVFTWYHFWHQVVIQGGQIGCCIAWMLKLRA